jgi:hypothetical protein
MAITIIRRGLPPGEQKYRGKCRNCMTIIECEGADTRFEQRDNARYVKCPVCNAYGDIEVEPFDMPRPPFKTDSGPV